MSKSSILVLVKEHGDSAGVSRTININRLNREKNRRKDMFIHVLRKEKEFFRGFTVIHPPKRTSLNFKGEIKNLIKGLIMHFQDYVHDRP